LFVAETRGKCAGLFIEIKKEGAKIFNTKGMYADQHVREQRKIIERLSQVGYKAMFGVGFQNCKEIIDAYMSQ
jgi:hypothetical protein